ncbi:serine hydrolase domain-containing protein [Amorphoplanes nipponensis]|uniref:Penicillin-binding protein n=1 Tax=Actinoplanes nipponensis TaxID=135950 RepID=A0A919JRB2_9ACTN|nr:serine hydrolase domain-containing protein [Actinoplanes nipponensis]GIE53910.1 penicillin-binding protein [Actinoplanes nipponensis]
MPDPAAVRAACRRIGATVRADHRYAHTSHLRVLVAGELVFDEHYRGPVVADVFSVTKTVVATVAGVAARQGLLPGLDEPLDAVLPALRGTPARGRTWRQLLSMTRGAAVDGPWDIDAVTARPGGQVAHIASAPSTDPPGRVFRYDNGAAHLLSAGLSRVVAAPVAEYAAAELFTPLGIADATWAADPDGVSYGFAHLRLSADALGRLGELWRAGGRPLLDPAFAAAMTTAQTPGGPPEELPYGLGIWVDDGLLLAGGWAGQHVVVLPGAVVVTTGDPGFDPGPPPRDELPPDWRPALDLVRRHLLPVLRG